MFGAIEQGSPRRFSEVKSDGRLPVSEVAQSVNAGGTVENEIDVLMAGLEALLPSGMPDERIKSVMKDGDGWHVPQQRSLVQEWP